MAGISSRPCSAHSRVRQLDALTSMRFFAALYVIFYHYWPAFIKTQPRPGFVTLGYSAVTFFFVLSGFILAYNYAAVDFSKPSQIRRFWVARFARIYPVYLLALLAGLPSLMALLVQTPDPAYRSLMASSLVLAPLGLQAWVPGAVCALDCPSWSVSTEFFFYALFPLLLPLVLKRPWASGGMAVVFCLLFVGIDTLLLARYGQGRSLVDEGADSLLTDFIAYFPAGRLGEFLLGMCLFRLWRLREHRWPILPLVALFCVIACPLVIWQEQLPAVAMHNGLTALAYAPLVLAAASASTGVFVSPVLVFLGRTSFSLYLLHIPVASTVRFIDRHVLGNVSEKLPWLMAGVTLCCAMAVACGVFLTVEEPMRRFITRSRLNATKRG